MLVVNTNKYSKVVERKEKKRKERKKKKKSKGELDSRVLILHGPDRMSS